MKTHLNYDQNDREVMHSIADWKQYKLFIIYSMESKLKEDFS